MGAQSRGEGWSHRHLAIAAALGGLVALARLVLLHDMNDAAVEVNVFPPQTP
jgi:hypothetical protein